MDRVRRIDFLGLVPCRQLLTGPLICFRRGDRSAFSASFVFCFQIRLAFWGNIRAMKLFETGAPERIRTTNLLIRSQMLYPVELRALLLGKMT